MPQKNQTLKESQAQLELALEAAQMGIWDWDIFTGQVNLSPQMETIYGLPAGSFGGTLEDYLACIYSEDIESVGNMIDYALETKTAIEFECRIVRPDGTLVWTSNRGNVLFDETGMPMGMIGATIDCSDRKTAEAATKAAEAKYRNIFENSVVGIYQTLPSGRFFECQSHPCPNLWLLQRTRPDKFPHRSGSSTLFRYQPPPAIQRPLGNRRPYFWL